MTRAFPVRRSRSFATPLLLLLCGSIALSQVRISNSLYHSSSPRVRFMADALYADTLELRAGKVTPVHEVNPKSPALAILLSAALPGAGQVYAERYWSIPVIWGLGYYFASVYSQENKQYHDYQTRFANSVLADTVNHQGNGIYLANRDFYRDERDRFAIYLGLTYILNIVDAYVGASLYSFDVSENLGGESKLTIRVPIDSIEGRERK